MLEQKKPKSRGKALRTLGARAHVAQDEAERAGLFSLENRNIRGDLDENFHCM